MNLGDLYIRIKAAWKMLTSKYYVALYAVEKDNKLTVHAAYSVTHESFINMVNIISEPFESHIANQEIEDQIKDALK